jgi:hypothetical protein
MSPLNSLHPPRNDENVDDSYSDYFRSNKTREQKNVHQGAQLYKFRNYVFIYLIGLDVHLLTLKK